MGRVGTGAKNEVFLSSIGVRNEIASRSGVFSEIPQNQWEFARNPSVAENGPFRKLIANSIGRPPRSNRARGSRGRKEARNLALLAAIRGPE